MQKTKKKINLWKKEKEERIRLATEDYELITNGKSFLLKQLGYTGDDYRFLGEVSRLIKELRVSTIESKIDENHLNVNLDGEISKSRLDSLLVKYGIPIDYDSHNGEAVLHNGGDFLVYIKPIKFDK